MHIILAHTKYVHCIYNKNLWSISRNIGHFKIDTVFWQEEMLWKLDSRVRKCQNSWNGRSYMVQEIEAILCVSRTVKEIWTMLCFRQKFLKFKMAAIFRKPKIFWNLGRVSCKCTLGVENLDKIALSRTVKEIWAILCFRRKFENSKWPPFFESRKFFEIWAEYLAIVPWGWKISTKSLYPAPLRR